MQNLLSAARALALVVVSSAASAQTTVTVIAAPGDGHRPRAVVDATGALHVVQGLKASRGDLVYIRQEADSSEFSDPIPVNTHPGIVAAFDMAVGAGGRIHVLARTNPKYSQLMEPDRAKIRFFDLKYMLYMRLNDAGDGFEPERNLAGPTLGFEGVGTILARGDHVLAFWHGQLEEEFGESARQVFRCESRDAGQTFEGPVAVEVDVEGACTCCALSGAWGEGERILLGFRNSAPVGDVRTKDSWLLVSEDLGRKFAGTLLEPWLEAGCPGSLGSVSSGPAGEFAAWRTRRAVRMRKVGDPSAPFSPEGDESTRIPLVVSNARGEVLFVWGAGSGPETRGGGDVAWQVFDPEGQPLGSKGRIRGGMASGWGMPAACVRPDGSFLIVYDGPGDSK